MPSISVIVLVDIDETQDKFYDRIKDISSIPCLELVVVFCKGTCLDGWDLKKYNFVFTDTTEKADMLNIGIDKSNSAIIGFLDLLKYQYFDVMAFEKIGMFDNRKENFIEDFIERLSNEQKLC